MSDTHDLFEPWLLFNLLSAHTNIMVYFFKEQFLSLRCFNIAVEDTY